MVRQEVCCLCQCVCVFVCVFVEGDGVRQRECVVMQGHFSSIKVSSDGRINLNFYKAHCRTEVYNLHPKETVGVVEPFITLAALKTHNLTFCLYQWRFVS